jgi:hypothetical protein
MARGLGSPKADFACVSESLGRVSALSMFVAEPEAVASRKRRSHL